MTSLAHDRLKLVLNDGAANASVDAYFSEAKPEVSTYTGRLFERFDGGGDRDDVVHSFSAADLVAVEALTVQVPPEAAYSLLHGPLASTMTKLLREVPTTIDLGSIGARTHIESGSAADSAWDLLAAQTGIGWVTAGKLMARKRPRLLPVYDRVVRCVLGGPKEAWFTLHEALSDPSMQDAVTSLSGAAPAHVSRLRVVDVAIWMHHHRDHAREECARFGPA